MIRHIADRREPRCRRLASLRTSTGSAPRRLGVESSGGMLRLGLVHYNTAEEVERALEALTKLLR
jgi:selenocysteine lyase/cysteine desulfurase